MLRESPQRLRADRSDASRPAPGRHQRGALLSEQLKDNPRGYYKGGIVRASGRHINPNYLLCPMDATGYCSESGAEVWHQATQTKDGYDYAPPEKRLLP